MSPAALSCRSPLYPRTVQQTKGQFYSSLIEAIALARPTSSATVLDFIMKRMQGRQQ